MPRTLLPASIHQHDSASQGHDEKPQVWQKPSARPEAKLHFHQYQMQTASSTLAKACWVSNCLGRSNLSHTQLTHQLNRSLLPFYTHWWDEQGVTERRVWTILRATCPAPCQRTQSLQQKSRLCQGHSDPPINWGLLDIKMSGQEAQYRHCWRMVVYR